MRILLTTTSYQDTPGKHHAMLADSGFTVVTARGPLTEAQLIDLIKSGPGFDGFLHGDDAITRNVMLAALPRLKVLSKYGIGLDSVDVPAATELKIPVLFTPGVNHTTVAEHIFGLIIMLAKDLRFHTNAVKAGQWKRVTGVELAGKTLGVLGFGRIGKEVAKRGHCFGMNVIGQGKHWDDDWANRYDVERIATPDELIERSNVLSLHMNLTDENRGIINTERIASMPTGAIIVNCARGALVVESDIVDACKSGKLRGYATDVLEEEPMKFPHPFQAVDNILVTPHIGSRTFESVERQALMSTENLIRALHGQKPLAQANEF